MSSSVLLVEDVDEATAILTLNRPSRRNALTVELMEALCQAVQSLAAEPRRRAVIVRGAGPAFCSGLDLDEAAHGDRAEASARAVARTFETLRDTPLVTIAAAHQAAYAGGAGLMACCDFVVAADDLRICFPEVHRGLVPALAAAALLGRLRDGELRELLLLGQPIDVERAASMGLVDRVVPVADLLAEARRLAAALLQGAPAALRQTKQCLRELRWGAVSQAFPTALEYHKQARLGEEAREGLTAFREHRKPIWPGRFP
jgi:methylglutaconyl-CoA hydratase